MNREIWTQGNWGDACVPTDKLTAKATTAAALRIRGTLDERDAKLRSKVELEADLRLQPPEAAATGATRTEVAADAFSVQAYEARLANKHLVFIGDSRVRYQVLNLQYFVTHGHWNKCENGQLEHVRTNCWLIDHRDEGGVWRGWRSWYVSSNQLFNVNGSHELCDCHREVAFSSDTTFENRYFTRHTKLGKIKITYLQNFGDSVKFHRGFPPFSNHSNERCIVGACDRSHNYSVMNTAQALERVVPRLEPTHVFASTGWVEKDIGCPLMQLQQRTGAHVFIISHISQMPGADPHSLVSKAFPSQGCGAPVYDRASPTRNLSRSHYWDTLHLLSTGNKLLNNMLLDLV